MVPANLGKAGDKKMALDGISDAGLTGCIRGTTPGVRSAGLILAGIWLGYGVGTLVASQFKFPEHEQDHIRRWNRPCDARTPT